LGDIVTKYLFMSEKRERFNSFDTIKFYVVFVGCTIGHFWQFTPKSYDAVCETAAMSKIIDVLTHFSFLRTHSYMELLFMISGFQMYIAYHERIAGGKLDFASYFKKRFERLYPPMIISTVVMSIGLLVYRHYMLSDWCGVPFIPRAFVMSILGIQAWNSDIHVLNGPLWFLSVLILCIIVYYWIERIGARFSLSVFALFIPIVFALSHLFDMSVFAWLHTDVSRGLFGFFTGAVFAAAYRYFDKKKLTIYSLVAILLFLILYFGFYEECLADGLDRTAITPVLVYGPMLLLLAMYPKADAIVGVKPLAFMGKTSFHLYCLNFPLYLWAMIFNVRFSLNINYESFWIFWLFVILQLVLSVVLYYLIDKKSWRVAK